MNTRQIICFALSFGLALSSIGWAVAIIGLGSQPEWLNLSILLGVWAVIVFEIGKRV